MDSSRIKTVVLLILLLVNLAFVGILVADSFHSADVESQAREELVAVMRANGIELEESSIPRGTAAAGYRLTRDAASELALVKAVLGDARAEDRGGNIYYYENNRGWARFHGNGEFELATRYETGKNLDELVAEWLKRLDISVDAASEERHYEDSYRSVSYVCVFEGGKLYNCGLTLRFETGGKLEISGRWPFAQTREQAQAELLSPSTVLIRLLSELRAGGVVCKRIDGMEQGWLMSASASEGELAPVWQIRTDGGDYYVDCETGARITDLGL